jgi:hypothetical protein
MAKSQRRFEGTWGFERTSATDPTIHCDTTQAASTEVQQQKEYRSPLIPTPRGGGDVTVPNISILCSDDHFLRPELIVTPGKLINFNNSNFF